MAAPLQYDQAACLARLQATSTRGVPARLRRVAGCATPTGSAGHAGATANLKLTFHLDHSAGADQYCHARTLGMDPQYRAAARNWTLQRMGHGTEEHDDCHTPRLYLDFRHPRKHVHWWPCGRRGGRAGRTVSVPVSGALLYTPPD